LKARIFFSINIILEHLFEDERNLELTIFLYNNLNERKEF